LKKRHNQAHSESHTDESWLIPYADILTLLLALFIILFASGQIDQKKYEQIMQGFVSEFTGGMSILEQDSAPIEQIQDPQMKEKQDMSEMKEKMDEYIDENGLSMQLETNMTEEDMLKIIIRDYALFDSGSASVKPEAQKLALDIADMLSQYPGYNVEVAGHTDNVPMNSPEFDSNWDLSAKRALNFMKYIIAVDNVNQARFRTIGYGEYLPIATNNTEEGRSKNRRVEVNINSKRV
jgi:chemotaxis protein MotB